MRLSALLPYIALFGSATSGELNGGARYIVKVEGEWVARASLTIPRQETAAVRIDGTVYVIGGMLDQAPATATPSVEVYDIATGEWSSVADMPVGLDHSAAVALDGRLYVIGGYMRLNNGAGQATGAVNVYTPSTGEWSPGVELPAPRAAGWAVSHRGKIYLFGGVEPGVGLAASTLIFDPEQKNWAAGAPMPTPREHLNAVSCGEYIYVVGGRSGGNSYTVNERYDPVANAWQTMTPMTTGRAAMFAAAWGSKIYCAGGETPQLFDVNEVYDVVTDSWSLDAPMAIPRHGLHAIPIDSGILAAGGGVLQGLEPTAAVDIFEPAHSQSDIDGNNTVNAVDVQHAINAVLGLSVGRLNADINGDGQVDVVDVQLAIDTALGLK